MGLKDTITRAINGDADADNTDAALDAVRAAQKSCEDCDARSVKLLQQIAAAEAVMGREANDEKARALADKIDALQKDRKVNDARRKAAVEQLQAAKIELHKLGNAKHIKVHRRNTAAMVKNVEDMNGHLDGYARCFVKHFELATKIRLSLPQEYQGSGGMMLSHNEFLQALALELWRIVPVHPIGPVSSYPTLPGSRFPLLGGAEPDKMQTLLDAVKEAVAYIMRRVEEGPLGEPETVAAKPVAPVAVVEAAAPITAPVQAPQTVMTAEQIDRPPLSDPGWMLV